MQNNILSTAFFRSENILKKNHKYQIFEDFTNRQICFWDAEKRENDIMFLLEKFVKGFFADAREIIL